MNNLIKFFVKYGIYFFFFALELYAIILIVNGNYFQRSVFYRNCDEITGEIYKVEEAVTYYLSLKEVNQDLSKENVELRNKVFVLENKLQSMKNSGDSIAHSPLDPKLEYTCLQAKVINNSTSQLQNFITLNRGTENGVKPEMSVVSPCGIVGIVTACSKHFSVVMPVLNPKSQISCKIKSRMNKDTVATIKDIGSLVWHGGDPRYAKMKQVPRHVKIKKGDSIVTSGYSDFFPEGIMVGTVHDFKTGEDDNYYDIDVELSVNFNNLAYVQVLDYKHKKEQADLEAYARRDSTKK